MLDYLIDAYVNRDASAGTPEATEEVLSQIDFVREAILSDISLKDWQGLPVYSVFYFHNGCGNISFCARQRYIHRDSQLTDDVLLDRLREFWRTYFQFERRPKKS